MDLWKILNPAEQAPSCSNAGHASRDNRVNASSRDRTSSIFAAVGTPDGFSAQSMAAECYNEPSVRPLPQLLDTLHQAQPGSTLPPFATDNTGDSVVGSLSEPSSLEDPRLGSGPFSTPDTTSRRGAPAVIAAIETMFCKIANSLRKKEELSIELKTKKSPITSQTPNIEERVSISEIRFPGRNAQEAWRFTVLLRILELVHQGLVENVVVSKRNLYYKDPSLFKSQQVVDRYVDILAFTIGVQRAALNVTAAAKGLVIGGFSLITAEGSVVRHDHDSEATLIGDIQDAGQADTEGAAWVLVVEKESSFRTLASAKSHQNSQAGKGIILTAKGYPDIATRKLLRLLATSGAPPPRVFALADFDPDGIAIMSNYKYGSRTLSHENAALNAPSIEWLGLRSCALLERHVDNADEGLLRLSHRDRKKAMHVLDKPQLGEDAPEKEWRRELQVMLMLGVKAEMEIMTDRVDGLEGWVDERLLEELHIQGNIMQR